MAVFIAWSRAKIAECLRSMSPVHMIVTWYPSIISDQILVVIIHLLVCLPMYMESVMAAQWPFLGQGYLYRNKKLSMVLASTIYSAEICPNAVWQYSKGALISHTTHQIVLPISVQVGGELQYLEPIRELHVAMKQSVANQMFRFWITSVKGVCFLWISGWGHFVVIQTQPL